VLPDHREQTLILLPEDAVEPNGVSYQHQLDETLTALGTRLQGRMLAIFPSHAALRAAYAGIKATLEAHDVLVLAQGQDGSIRQLWQNFNTQPRVVLLGAGAFWEGMEVEGRAPACIVVTRIPFPSLSDPLLAARAEAWHDQQNQFVVPHAALKLRQALTGLAWSQRTRNAVVLFDHRLVTRGYGPTLLAALPRSTVRNEPLTHLADQVAEWVGGAEPGGTAS
jgi:Rad3-related DNA helicase